MNNTKRLASIISILIVIEFLMLKMYPDKMIDMARKVYKNKNIRMIYLLLFLFGIYYLSKEMSMIQIVAASFVIFTLFGYIMLEYKVVVNKYIDEYERKPDAMKEEMLILLVIAVKVLYDIHHK